MHLLARILTVILLAYRTIAGMGLGGEFGIGMALVTEAWPAATRVASYVGLGWQAGVLAAALVTPLLLPIVGWRGIFALGLLPAVLSFAIRKSVGEPTILMDLLTTLVLIPETKGVELQ